MIRLTSPWYEIRNADKADSGPVEVRLFGEIGWEITATDFVEALDSVGDRDVDLRIASAGGAVIDGVHIYNRLVMHKGTVNGVIEGLAASMASVIAMACERLEMMEIGWLMIHNPSGGLWGQEKDMRRAAEVLAKMKAAAVDAYAKKTKLERERIESLMDDETWMTPEEALELGFIDGVAEAPDLDMAACVKRLDLNQFKNVPDSLRQAAAGPDARVAVAADLFSMPTVRNKFVLVGEPAHKPSEEPAEMDEEKKRELEAAFREAETKRKTTIVDVFNGFEGFEELQQKCLDDFECTAEIAQERLLAAMKARNDRETHPVGSTVHVLEDQRDKAFTAAAQWLTYRAGGIDPETKKRISLSGDNPYKGRRLLDLAEDCVGACGISTRGMSQKQIVMTAITHSTSDFPNIMQNALHKMLLDSFNLGDYVWRRIAKIGDLSDFRPHWRHIAGSFSDLVALNENGELQDGTLDDTRKESITASTKGRIMNLSHQAIINDDMSVFDSTARLMGRAAARAVEPDFFALLALNSDMGPTMSDAATLFHATHGNVSTGAPSVDAIEAALTVLKQQQLPNPSTEVVEYLDFQGDPIFLGPLSMRGDVTVINEAQYDPDTANKLQKPNKSRGLLGEIVTTPRRTGTPWYLFVPPAEAPVIEVGFVQGEQEPQMEMIESFRQYGVSWRVVYDYGVAGISWLGCVRSTGA